MASQVLTTFSLRSTTRQIRQEGTSCNAAHGFILIAVLWISLLLSIFALNYSTSSRLGAERAVTGERFTTETHVLRSALAMAEHGLRKYLANIELIEELADSGLAGEVLDDVLRPLFPRHEPHELDISGTRVQVRITNETARWNVNAVSAGILEKVLAACGVEPGAETTSIVNSILDWIDEDDLRRLEGAETPYYLSLDRPYLAKNGPLQSIEELLLIRGIDAALYWGSEGRPGLIDFLSVTGQGGETLDINSASPRAMTLVPGIGEDAVNAVVQNRSEGRIRNLADLALHVDARDFDQLVQFFEVMPSSRAKLEARVVDPVTGRPGRAMTVVIDLS
ncbi:general secretion pathway protein GspK [Desulfonatronum thioautotrophicum]|uniref:general secretion pathway protein GspK n=1 Tax=Desulfonatronum thioautotrophicum TaxID=617001 RepID=UPI0005EB5204|nr:type II secretion system protein GspK [Desulfonatronum thioautotrophicum]